MQTDEDPEVSNERFLNYFRNRALIEEGMAGALSPQGVPGKAFEQGWKIWKTLLALAFLTKASPYTYAIENRIVIAWKIVLFASLHIKMTREIDSI